MVEIGRDLWRLSSPILLARSWSSRAGWSAPCSLRLWIYPRMEIPKPYWESLASIWPGLFGFFFFLCFNRISCKMKKLLLVNTVTSVSFLLFFLNFKYFFPRIPYADILQVTHKKNNLFIVKHIQNIIQSALIKALFKTLILSCYYYCCSCFWYFLLINCSYANLCVLPFSESLPHPSMGEGGGSEQASEGYLASS